MSEIKLKPCPFCGGEVYINYETMTDERRIYWAQILCKKCHCRSAGNWSNSYANAEKKEREAWNTRKPMERIVVQLEKAIEDTTDTETGMGARWAYKGAIEIVQKGGSE